MSDFLKKTFPFDDGLIYNLKTTFSISLGFFLFLLFFLPLNPQNPEFTEKTLILAGFSAITFLLFTVPRILLPLLFPKTFAPGLWTQSKELVVDGNLIIFQSVAFIFYARYVGLIQITFPVVIKMVLMAIATTITLVIVNNFRGLKIAIQLYAEELKKNSEFTETPGNRSILEFESENKTESILLPVSQILLIRSANNYIEIFWEEEGKILRKLIRNTLRSTETKVTQFPEFVRCHRTCIVNLRFISKYVRDHKGERLKLSYSEEEIPISRQYAFRVKEALKKFCHSPQGNAIRP